LQTLQTQQEETRPRMAAKSGTRRSTWKTIAAAIGTTSTLDFKEWERRVQICNLALASTTAADPMEKANAMCAQWRTA